MKVRLLERIAVHPKEWRALLAVEQYIGLCAR
jgi:hypothetical protein